MNKKIVATIKWILLALLASVVIWHFALYVSSTLDANLTVSRITFGVIVSLLAILLVTVLNRHDKSKPKAKTSVGILSHLKILLAGAGWYVVPAMVGLGIASLFGVVEISTDISFTDAVGVILLVAVLVFISEALPEEIIFRGYIFGKLAKLGGRWVTIFLQAALFLLFAFMIGALDSSLDASFIFVYGLSLGILRWVFGSVAAPIGFHLACMTIQQSFSTQWSPFNVSDSMILQTFVFGMLPMSVVIAYYVTKMSAKSKKS